MAAIERIEHTHDLEPARPTTIPQRELRNNIGEVLRRAEAGEQLTITVSGRPVAVLGPVPEPPSMPVRKKGTAEGLRRVMALFAEDPTWGDDIRRMREEDRADSVDIWADR